MPLPRPCVRGLRRKFCVGGCQKTVARVCVDIRYKRVELFDRSAALVPSLDHHLFFLDHVHAFDPGERALGSIKGYITKSTEERRNDDEVWPHQHGQIPEGGRHPAGAWIRQPTLRWRSNGETIRMSQPVRRCLLAVFAHPDDETSAVPAR